MFIPDSRVKKAPNPGYRIRICNTGPNSSTGATGDHPRDPERPPGGEAVRRPEGLQLEQEHCRLSQVPGQDPRLREVRGSIEESTVDVVIKQLDTDQLGD
jgi:hypothetical protein